MYMVQPGIYVDDGRSFPATMFRRERGLAMGRRIKDVLMRAKERELPIRDAYCSVLGEAREVGGKWELSRREGMQRDIFGTGRVYVRTTSVEYALCAIRTITETGRRGITVLEKDPFYNSGITATGEPVTHGKKSLLAALAGPRAEREGHADMRDILAAYGAEASIREVVLAVPCGEGVFGVAGRPGEYLVRGGAPIDGIIMIVNDPGLLREVVRAEAYVEKLRRGEEAGIGQIQAEIMGGIEEMLSSMERPGAGW
jgi:hypothetical protein